MIDFENLSERAVQAEKHFKDGYNCAQSVVLAFSDLIDIDQQALLRMASPFGGGMGRMREVCGTVSGMNLVLGYLEGYSLPGSHPEKTAVYQKVRDLAGEFSEINGSFICRELLAGVPHTDGGIPEQRTEGYYKRRPCGKLVACATMILENHLREEGFEV